MRPWPHGDLAASRDHTRAHGQAHSSEVPVAHALAARRDTLRTQARRCRRVTVPSVLAHRRLEADMALVEVLAALADLGLRGIRTGAIERLGTLARCCLAW